MKETKFKYTEIGPIPEEWEVVSLGNIGNFSKGKGISRAEANNGSIPAIRYGEIYTTHNDYIKRFTSFIKENVARYSTRLKCGDILFTASGETKEEIGKAVAFVDNIEAYAGGDIIILSPQKHINSVFLAFLLNTKIVVKQKSSKAQGDAVVHITKSSIASLQIPLPPLSEQSRIASALTSIDNLLTSLGKLIAKKKQIKQGTMQQLLTGKKRLKGFSDPWVEKRLGDIGEFLKGNGLSKNLITACGVNECMLYGEIFTRFNYVADGPFFRTNCLDGLPSCVGDILMPGSTTTKGIDLVKAVCISKSRVMLGGDIIVLRNSYNMYNPNFLAYLISEIDREKIAEITQGITIIHLHSKNLEKITYFIPPTLTEQTAIAEVLTAMDSEITALEGKLAKYQQIKQGMMQQLLTGKIRLI